MIGAVARRFFLDPLPTGGEVELSAELTHHLAGVLRARPGETVTLFDGRGHEAAAEVLSTGGRRARVRVVAVEPNERGARVAVEVAFAVPRPARAEWLFEHGTEVGIAAFRPIRTARARTPPGPSRRERWRRLVIAAAGQCGRGRLPEIHTPLSLEELAARTGLPGERYVVDPRAATPLGPARSPSALLVVGPEGGFAEEELATLAAAGFAFRHLGDLILRTETAVLAGTVRLLGEPHGTSP